MTIRRNTPQFDALRHLAAQLGGRYELDTGDLGTDRAGVSNDLKLARLVATGRPFTAVTPAMQQAVVRYARAAAAGLLTQGGAIRTEAFWAEAAKAVQAHLLLRFTAQGNDVALAPLSPLYRAWKARHGLSTLIGIARGDLVRALRAARFAFRKTG